MSRELDTALECAGRGWPVFPCGRTKKPLIPKEQGGHGYLDATTDEAQIRAWWEKNPHAMVGIATEASGLVVVDIDRHDGASGRQSWEKLVAELGPELEDTATTQTFTGGWHRYYQANGQRVKSVDGFLKGYPGLDVKAMGGYVIAYDWTDDHGPDRLHGIPAALLPKLPRAGEGGKDREPAPPLAKLIASGEGRWDALRTVAGKMRRGGCELPAIEAALLAMNKTQLAEPYPESEVRRVARDIAAKRPGELLPAYVSARPPIEVLAAEAAAVSSSPVLVDEEGPRRAADEVDHILDVAEQWEPGEGARPLVHEAAHAEGLAQAWRGRYRWAQHEGTWRRWTGKVWEAVAEPAVVSAAQHELRRHYALALAEDHPAAEDKRLMTLHTETCRYSSVLGGLAFLKGEEGFFTEFEAWDADPYALNCADGILDVRRRELRPHDPAALRTRMCRWSYGDETTSGAWQHHLELCLPDPDVHRQVQRDLGRALVDAVLEHSLPIWYGVGRNGKSTTQDALQKGLDGYTRQAAKNLLMAAKYERHTTEIADLAGARLVFSEEIEAGKDLDEVQVKKLTGGGPQKARFMRQDNFEFKQTFSIFLLTNHHPVVKGTDKAIWARLRLVPWTISIPLAQQRPQDEVVAELVADGSWMLRWMVDGFADWQADHHWVAGEVQAATAAYRREQDRLAGFIADECEERMRATADVTALYAAYQSWCIATGEDALGKIAFGRALRDRGIEQTKGAQGARVWVGIRQVATGGRNSALFTRDDFSKDEPEKLPPLATAVRDEQAKEPETAIAAAADYDDDIPF